MPDKFCGLTDHEKDSVKKIPFLISTRIMFKKKDSVKKIPFLISTRIMFKKKDSVKKSLS